MRVQFHRGGQPDQYVVLVGRDDGRVARLPGYDGHDAVPHHLVHFVAEHEFHLIHGVFGCIAAGAMFSNMSLVGARPRYDAQVRSRAVLRAHAAELALAETLSGVVDEAAEHDIELSLAHRRLREAWGTMRSGACPYPLDDLRRVLRLLRQLSARWRSQRPGEVLALRWDVPPDRPLRSRSASGRAA
jgi:hypothetical protein